MTNTMKKLAVLLIGTLFVLCVAIVLTVSLPVSTAFAAETETATDTESEATVHDHDDDTWTELTSDGGIIGEGSTAENPAKYYLEGNVELTTDITIAENAVVTLCLNGYMLTGTGTGSVITSEAGADFTLEDCQSASGAEEHQHKYYVSSSSSDKGMYVFDDGTRSWSNSFEAAANKGTVTGGVITGGRTITKEGGGVWIEGTFTMNGGTIAGNAVTFGGGGVYVYHGTFTMNGGMIAGHKASCGLWMDNGTFTMNGGTISDNCGSGVYIIGEGKFEMTNGTISGNTADVGYGSGVSVFEHATFTMSGGTISGNTTDYYGGGVCVWDQGSFTMSGGTISDNTATGGDFVPGYGGGVCAWNQGSFTMSGGTISGNTATRNGGGVYVDESASFTMSGGYFDGEISSAAGTVSISGGYFTQEPTAYLAENCGLHDLSALGGAAFDSDYKDGFPYAVYKSDPEFGMTANGDRLYDGDPIEEDIDFTVSGADGIEFDYSYLENGESFTGLPSALGTYTVRAFRFETETKMWYEAEFTIGIVEEYTVQVTFDGQTNNYESIFTALEVASGFAATAENRAVITLLGNIDFASTLTFDTGFVTLDLDGYMLKMTGSGSVIEINAGADLILADSKGANATHNYYVSGSGLWVFYDGDLPADAENAETGVVTGGVITGGSNANNGGGVELKGTFTMNGGAISGNTATYDGGGVYIFRGSTFTMNGGAISGNTATYDGGVYVGMDGTFMMNGGAISGNTATYDGGVCVGMGGTFTMNGGTISGNTATYDGGGVYVGVGGTFTMNGGTISGNTANTGGGVCVQYGTFTMSGGTISGNTAYYGGVYVYVGSFTMSGGTISGNTATYDGGGVYVGVGGTFTMNGGYLGGSVYISSGTVSVSGGYFAQEPTAYLAENCAAHDISALGGADFDSDYMKGFPYAVYMNGTAEITASADGNIVYDGEPVAAGTDFTVSGAEGLTLGYMHKQNDGEYTSGLPAEAGEYTTLVCALDYAQKTYCQMQFTLTVEKAIASAPSAPTVTGTLTYGQELSGLTLSDGWAWGNGATVPAVSDSGVTGYEVKIAVDDKNYDWSGVEGYADGYYTTTVTVFVSAKDITVTITPNGGTYGGSVTGAAAALNGLVGEDDPAITLTYTGNGYDSTQVPTNAGTYTVTATIADANYNLTGTMTATFTIAKAGNSWIAEPAIEGWTYGEQASAPQGKAQFGEVVFCYYRGEHKLDAVPTAAGEYKLVATIAGTDNYGGLTREVNFTVAKATYDMAGVTFADDSVTYDGQAHGIEIVGTLPEGVTVTYEGNGKTDAGEYTVTAKFTGDSANYNAIPDMTATLTITKAAPAYTAPTELTVCVDGTLADITLPEGWAWKDGAVQFGEAGEYKAVAVYTPADVVNFDPVEVELTITVLEPEGLSDGAIAGIVIVSILVALLLAYAIGAVLYKKKLVKGAFFEKIYPFIKD